MAGICLRPRRSRTRPSKSSKFEVRTSKRQGKVESREGSHVRKHVVVIAAALVAVTIAWLTPTLRADGQRGAGAQGAQPRTQSAAAPAGPIKRLPDGTPDIRGVWTRVGGGLNEADAPDSELKAFGVLSEPQGFGQGQVASGPGGEVAEARVAKYLPNPRPPQGVVDPADRKLPYSPEARARRLDNAKNMFCPP